MGSKSSDVAAPDPRLVEAQIRSMGVQETAIRQIMDSSAELMPLQKEQMQFGLDSARTSYDQSQADRKYAIERRDKLTGLQDNIIDEAKQFNTGDRAKELAGKAIAGVNQSFDSAGDIAKRNLTRAGVNPADGKFADMSKQLTIARALGGASAGTAAQGQARAEGLALNDRAANVLAGYPAMGMNTTGQGAQFGANGMNIVNAGANGMNAGYSNASQMAASWGNNATGMFGQQANYKTAQDQAQGNPLSDITQLVGTGLGAYAKFGSARAYKQGIERVGTHASGLGIYSFEYRLAFRAKWGAGRIVGVMADEVASIMPAALSLDADGHTVVDYSMIF